MTNYEWLRIKTRTPQGLIETLCELNETDYEQCILCTFEKKELECPIEKGCEECISDWLDKEINPW